MQQNTFILSHDGGELLLHQSLPEGRLLPNGLGIQILRNVSRIILYIDFNVETEKCS